jgi:hypothetical protein
MNRFKHYLSAGCISFTFSSLFYLLFSLMKIFPSMSETMIINMLFISISINFLIFLTHQLPIQSSIILRLMEFLDVIIVLLVAGAVFDIFPFNWYYTTFVIATGLLTYVVVIVVIFMGNQSSAIQINDVISRKKRGVTVD